MSAFSYLSSKIFSFIVIIAITLLLLCPIRAQISSTEKITPLKVEGAVGPLMTPYNRSSAVGAAFVFGGTRPDLFVRGEAHEKKFYLFKYLRDDPQGTPIFAPPTEVNSPFMNRGSIFQTEDGAINGFWLSKGQIVRTIFNRQKLAFEEVGKISLPPELRAAQNLSVLVREGQGLDLAFDLVGDTKPAKTAEANPSSVDWRPYDAAGISTLAESYMYFMTASMADIGGPVENVRQLSPTKREVYMSAVNLAALRFGPGLRGVASGSRAGNFYYYPFKADASAQPTRRLLLAGVDGNALRHPGISASIVAYPRKDGITDFISGGEYGAHFYLFADRFLPSGAPIFHPPVSVLQEDVDLYVGALPTLSVVDWDGDGLQDIIAGNASGFIMFLKNVGSNDAPSFLPGINIQADGRDIQHQAGYSGSIQGLHEFRWGYVGPNAVDWNDDGLPDLVVSDITGNYVVYINRGSKTEPRLEAAHPIYCYGLNLHGMWRCRPGVAKIDGKTALLTVDGEDQFHLYWRIDDYNVEDGGPLRLEDGSVITASIDPGGGTGRVKFDFFDVDVDGRPDLIIGTGRRSAIPNQQTGYPLPVLGKKAHGTPLFMKNMGTKNGFPIFAPPQPFSHESIGLVQPGGGHETGAVGTTLGGGKFNLLVANQSGQIFLLRGSDLRFLTLEEAAQYRDRPNPFPGSTR